jgi:hypothetical protein
MMWSATLLKRGVVWSMSLGGDLRKPQILRAPADLAKTLRWESGILWAVKTSRGYRKVRLSKSQTAFHFAIRRSQTAFHFAIRRSQTAFHFAIRRSQTAFEFVRSRSPLNQEGIAPIKVATLPIEGVAMSVGSGYIGFSGIGPDPM